MIKGLIIISILCDHFISFGSFKQICTNVTMKRCRLLQFLPLALFILPSVLGQLCPEGWLESPVSDYCFQFNPKRISKTWAEARKACQARLGDLAWYENTEERSFIVKTAGRMSQADPETEAFWVGLTDEVKEGEWKWVSEKAGTGSSLIDWAHNEPNGANSENCGEVLVKSDSFNVGKMNDKDCYSPFPYICKRPKAVVDNCPSNWQQVQDLCYRFFDLEKGWHSAHHDCKRYGAELVTVDNEVQQQYIYDVSRFEDKPVWIGYESFNNNGGLGWKKNGVVLPPPSGKEQETSSEFWSDGKRPIQLRNHAVCAEVVPTSEESRKSWVINNCQAERPYMCKKPEGTCATGWQPHNGTCYQFNGNLKLSWYDAATYCQSQGGEMVTIERKDIQHFLIRKIGGLEFDKNLNIWIGGSDIDYKPKTLHWSNKMAMSGGYTNWLAGQPMTSANNPLCVQMTADQGNWTASERCTAEQTFICQISDRKVVLPPTVAPAKGSCEPGWEGFAFSCYYFSGETASWLDAQKACQNRNAHLVKVNNAREMSFIDRKLTADSWLGLNDRQSEAHWVWHDKTPAKYTNWGPGKPDNAEYRHGEQCAAVMRGHLKGLWDDMICSDKLAYVCQKDIGPKTTSGPITMGPSYGAKCGPFWEDDTLSDYCYQFNTDTLSWTEAQLQCQHNGGELTSITGLHEQQYIAGRIRMIPEMRYFWLGGNDLRFENGWVWNDDSPFAFINWGDGQPESGWNADCMEIDASTGDWKDRDCKSRRGYICKKKGSGLSTTTTTSTATEQPGSPYCPKKWSLYGKSCYKVFQEKKMWNLAKDVCRREGGDLVSIAGENEANFVAALAGEWNDDKSEFWIGLNALRVVNLFEWSDDSSVTYTSWRPNEPNNHQGKERCVSLYADGYDTGKWNDNDCAQWLPYVCKKPAPRMVNPPPVTYTGCPYERATGAYKGSCYSVFATGATWHGAEWACNSTGGYLVAINDHLEQAYISGQIGGRLTVNMEFWTGLSKGGEGTSYEWISGDWVSFTNWDDAHMGNEKDVCVVVSKTYKSIGEWSDRNCNEEKFFICEYKKDGYLPTPAPTTPKGQCPTKYGWREYGNYCYKTESFYGRSKKTWSQAREYCIAIGGDLASFHSEDQMRNATSISASSRYTDLYWIGLSKPTKSSNYVWSDNSALDYTNWKAGEPNDHNGREQCVEIDKYGGEWNDVNCNARRDVMCQIRKGDPLLTTMSTVSPTPAPTCGSDSKWLAHKDYCYFISESYGSGTKSWYDARKYCMQNGGDLASIHDSDENDFLLLETSKNSKQKYWIGLNELDLQSYKWSDGTPTDFIWWEINEPNNFLGGQKCVDFYTSTGHWNDDNCGDLESYICKKHKDSRTTATPAPTPVLQGNCPPGFQGIGNKCFMLVGDDVDSSQLKNYTNAVAACAALNKKYTLASITNPLEQALVTSMLKGKKVDFWLGLNKLILRRFQWTDNSQFDFTYWDYGEPDGSSYGSDREDCVSLTTSGSSAGHWRDRDCDLKLGYLCETWKDPSQPAPPVTQSPASCPRGYDTYGSDCYQMTAAMTWDNAKATCERQGDKLVSVLDSYEEAFLILYTQRTKPQPVWLGMKRNGRSYYWDDGWPVDYANWANSEPSREDAEMCVALMPDGRWNDTVCSASIQGVCKKSSAVPPSAATDSPGYCPDDKSWFKYGSYCYLLNGNAWDSWPEANHECYQLGASLLTVTSQEEMNFIKKIVRTEDIRGRNVWIGLLKKPGGAFGWYDNTALSYVNWATGEPAKDEDKGCVSIHPASGNWELEQCSYSRGYICKIAKVPISTTPGPSCRSGWYLRENVCYKGFFEYDSNKKSWEEARSFCRAEGGDLASFHSEAEKNWYLENLGYYYRYSVGKEPSWIGLRIPKNAANNQHTWSDGTAADYFSWEKGQPDNHNGKEKCVSMISSTGEWRDDNCAGARSWVCKAPYGATPLPSTTTPSSTDHGECGKKWSLFGDNCYFFSELWGDNSRESWFKSREYCLSNAGDLVSIHSEAEADFVTTLVSKSQHMKLWVGASNFDFEGYSWTDGSPMNYINWAKGEPNSLFGDQRCVNIYSGTDGMSAGTFNDDNCGDPLPFICKKHKSSSTPGTVATTPNIQGNCPREFQGIGNRCYKFMGEDPSERKNWTNAAKACQAMGKGFTLASITNPMEQAFITSHLQAKGTDYWIGLSDYYKHHFFRWLSNEDIIYTNWGKNQPTNSWSSDDEQCVQVRAARGSIGKWADSKCSDVAAFICQTWKDAKIPTPWTPASTPAHPCKPGYRSFDGQTCYKLYTEPKMWTYAHRQCTEDKTLLAFVPDALAEANLQTFMIETQGQPVWLGLKDLGYQRFMWVNEWPLDYTNWAENEPRTGNGEACGVMRPDGKWQNSVCHDKFPFICMTTTVPAPTTVTPMPGWCPDAPEGQPWLEYGTSCFYYNSNAYENWAEANFECYKRGGHLASFANQDESDFIFGLLENEVGPRNMWIGLVRRTNTDPFEWYDGSTVDFTHWAQGEPSNNGGNENCVEYRADTGEWNDNDCSVNMGFICSTPRIIPTTSTTTVSTTLGTGPTQSSQPGGSTAASTLAPSPVVPEKQAGNKPDSTTEGVGLTGGNVVGVIILCVVIVALLAIIAYVVRKQRQQSGVLAFYSSEHADKVQLSGSRSSMENPVYDMYNSDSDKP